MVFSRKKQTLSNNGKKIGRAPLPLPTNPARSTNRRSRSVQRRDPSVTRRDPSSTRSNSVISRNSSTASRSSSAVRSTSVSSTTRRRSNSMSRAGSAQRNRYEDPQIPGFSIPTGDEGANKFVQYQEFGMDPIQEMRVMSINEIPALRESSDVVVKVKVKN